ncbi:MAG: N4-gp56 family major capsid protein [Candidatus Bipolaricaulis sp.]|nr:N4-gp56 family major capsid protein [Candidatus Bipolaricaulis sp.]
MTWAVGTQAANLGRASGASSGAAAKDIKTLYKANYLLNREPELIFQQFAQKQANMDIPLNKGDNIEFTRYSPLATSATHNLLVEGTEPDAEAYYAQTVTAVLDEYGNFVQPSSRVWLTAFDPKLGGLARLLGIQSGKSLDLKIQQVLAQGFIGMRADADSTYQGVVVSASSAGTTTVPIFDSLPSAIASGTTSRSGVIVWLTGKNQGISRTFVGASSTTITISALPHAPTDDDTAWICDTYGLTTGDKITCELIKKAVAFLEKNETPTFPDGYYHGVCPSGEMVYDFMNDTEYVNLKHYAAPKDLYRNLIGEYANVRFHKDSHPYKHTAGTLGTYVATAFPQMISIFGSDAFGNVKLAGKEQVFEVCPPEFSTATPLAMFGTMSWKNMYCPLVLNGAWGVNIFAVPTSIG